jgi:hypothetical protein
VLNSEFWFELVMVSDQEVVKSWIPGAVLYVLLNSAAAVKGNAHESNLALHLDKYCPTCEAEARRVAAHLPN